MAASFLPDRVTTFIDALTSLSTEQWQTVIESRDELLGESYSEAAHAAKPSAAQFSAIDKAIATAIRPRVPVIQAIDKLAITPAINASQRAAFALLSEKLTREQHDILVRPFREAGLPPALFSGSDA